MCHFFLIGNKNHYLVDGGPTASPGSGAVHFYANVLEVFLKYAFKVDIKLNIFKADGILVTHNDSDHYQGIQRLLKEFPPNQDPTSPNAKFEFSGPLLIHSDLPIRFREQLQALQFKMNTLKEGEEIKGFEKLFTFYTPRLSTENQLYYYKPGKHAYALATARPVYSPDTSPKNLSSTLLNVSNPNNASEVLVSLNGDTVGYLALQGLAGKCPTVFKVPHHGSRHNSIPLEHYEPCESKQTKQLLAAQALLELKASPESLHLLAYKLVTIRNKECFNKEFKTRLKRDRDSDTVTAIKGLNYDNTLIDLAVQFESCLHNKGIDASTLLNILQNRMKQIESNLRDPSIPSTEVYTKGMDNSSLQLPNTFDYKEIKTSTLKSSSGLATQKAFGLLFTFLESDSVFLDGISLHLTTAFYQQIKAKTFFISSGNKHNHPHWQVVSGIIAAAQLTHKSDASYNCRVLLTSGNGIDEDKLPDNSSDDWTKYISLQYFAGETASVKIEPDTDPDPMMPLSGALKYEKGSLAKTDLLEKYNNAAGALELQKLRSASHGMYAIKVPNKNLWLNFEAVAKQKKFLLSSKHTFLNISTTSVLMYEGKILFTLTLFHVNKLSEGLSLKAVLGPNVPESGKITYKLMKSEKEYLVVTNNTISYSANFATGSYFLFETSSPGSDRSLVAAPIAPPASENSSSLLNYLNKSGLTQREPTCGSVLQILLGEPNMAHVSKSTLNSFLQNVSNLNLCDSSKITGSSAVVVLELPSLPLSLYSFSVVSVLSLHVEVANKAVDLVVQVTDDFGTSMQLQVPGLNWVKDKSKKHFALSIPPTKSTPITPAQTAMSRSAENHPKLSLSEFLEWIHSSIDPRTITTTNILDLVVSEEVTSQIQTSGKLSKDSDLYKFIHKSLSWNIDSSSSFEVFESAVLSASISLLLPSKSQKFMEFSVLSTSLLITNAKTNHLKLEMEISAVDANKIPVVLNYNISDLVEEFVQMFPEYLKALGVKSDPNSYNFLDDVMFLLNSETNGFLAMSSFTRGLVSTVLEWNVNLKQTTVRYTNTPTGPQLLEGTLIALVPDKYNTADLGINKVTQLTSITFHVPDLFEVLIPYITADVIVGGKPAKLTATAPNNDLLPSLKIELNENIGLSEMVSFLSLGESFSAMQIPMLSKALKDVKITTAGFTVQQQVANSRQSWLSSVFFATQFANISSYLPPVFSKLSDVHASVVVYQPLLSNKKVSLDVKFHFQISLEGQNSKPENIAFDAQLSVEPVVPSARADKKKSQKASYNVSVSLLSTTSAVGSNGDVSLSAVLSALGLNQALSSADSIPFMKSLLQSVTLKKMIVAFNTGSKNIKSFLLELHSRDWKLIPGKLELPRLDCYFNYSDGVWAGDFNGIAFLVNEYPISIQFTLPPAPGEDQAATLSFSNSNLDFTIKSFLSVFELGSITNVPILSQVLDATVTEANVSLLKSDSGVQVTEGKVSLYLESVNISSVFSLLQVSATIGFVYAPEESRYVFGFSVSGFFNQTIYLSAAYDLNTEVLSGNVVVASFQVADLTDVVKTFLLSNTLKKNSVYNKVSNFPTAAISVALERRTGDFRLQHLNVDLRNVFSFAAVSLEQLKLEFSTGPSQTKGTVGRKIELTGVLKSKDKHFGAIVIFNLEKDTTGHSSVKASIAPAEKNTLTLSAFLSLFDVTAPLVPTVGSQKEPNFFDLTLTEGSIELSLPDFKLTAFNIKVETTNAVNLLDSPKVLLENLSFEVKYSSTPNPTTTGTLQGIISLLGIKVEMEGDRRTDGTVFKAVATSQSANLQEFINTLTPSSTPIPKIPSEVGLPQAIPVGIAEFVIGLLNDKNYLTFNGTSQLQWVIDLGFADFHIHQLGGIVKYVKTKTKQSDKTSEFIVYVTGLFQFSSSISMSSELHFGPNSDTVLSVLVTDAKQVKVNTVANNLLGFNASPSKDSIALIAYYLLPPPKTLSILPVLI